CEPARTRLARTSASRASGRCCTGALCSAPPAALPTRAVYVAGGSRRSGCTACSTPAARRRRRSGGHDLLEPHRALCGRTAGLRLHDLMERRGADIERLSNLPDRPPAATQRREI